jgi:hypothetical protein
MPLGANASLDAMYATLRLLHEETARLEREVALLTGDGDAARRYILEVESRAIEEEAAKLSATISDLLDRDLQR